MLLTIIGRTRNTPNIGLLEQCCTEQQILFSWIVDDSVFKCSNEILLMNQNNLWTFQTIL